MRHIIEITKEFLHYQLSHVRNTLESRCYCCPIGLNKEYERIRNKHFVIPNIINLLISKDNLFERILKYIQEEMQFVENWNTLLFIFEMVCLEDCCLLIPASKRYFIEVLNRYPQNNNVSQRIKCISVITSGQTHFKNF